MFPNDIINHILSEVTEKDKIHFASTCKTWMNWVIDHVVFKTLVKRNTFKSSPFSFNNFKLVIKNDLIPLIPKINSITYLLLDMGNLLLFKDPSDKIEHDINEWLSLLVNLKQLVLDCDVVKYKKSVIKGFIINVPKGVDVLKIMKSDLFSDEFTIYVDDIKPVSLISKSIYLIYSGKKIIISGDIIKSVKINSSQCTHLQLGNEEVILNDTVFDNLKVLECDYDWAPKGMRKVYFNNLEVLTFNINNMFKRDPTKMLGTIYRALLTQGCFPKLEILNINGYFDFINNLKNMDNLKELNVSLGPSSYLIDPYGKYIDAIKSTVKPYPNLKLTLID